MQPSTVLANVLLALPLLASTAAHAQLAGYWADASGKPWRDASGQCLRSAQWSADRPHPACDAMPDRVVLLPGPDGKAGAVIVQSRQGQQTLSTAFGGIRVGADGRQSASVEDAQAVQQRYAAVLQAQPARPVSFVVQFAAGSASELTLQSQPQIERLKQILKERAAPEISVIGHTDRVGSVDANDKLSLRRAEAVKQILKAAGVDAALIEVAGRGEREPLVATADEVAEPANRRVEINLR